MTAQLLAITLVILLLATPIHRMIGATGASVISRVMGMILAAVAVDAILKGFVVLGVITAFQQAMRQAHSRKPKLTVVSAIIMPDIKSTTIGMGPTVRWM